MRAHAGQVAARRTHERAEIGSGQIGFWRSCVVVLLPRKTSQIGSIPSIRTRHAVGIQYDKLATQIQSGSENLFAIYQILFDGEAYPPACRLAIP